MRRLSRFIPAPVRRRLAPLLRPKTSARAVPLGHGPVFVFHGGNRIQPGLGRRLYAAQPSFRAAIDRAEAPVHARMGFSLTSYLLQTAMGDAGLVETERQRIVLLSACELALFELWKEHAVEPAVTMGACSGEIAAAYAAGALSFEDSIATACAVATLVTRRPMPGHYVTVDASFTRTSKICRDAPVSLDASFEISPTTTLCYCSEADFEAARTYLTSSGVTFRAAPSDWAHHAPRYMVGDTGLELFHPTPAPLTRGFYSTLAAGLVPAGALLDADHWYVAAAAPGRFGQMVTLALEAGFTSFVNVSANPALKTGIRQTAALLSRTIELRDSLRHDEPDERTWETTLQRLKADGLWRPAEPSHARVGDARPVSEISLLRPDVVQNPYAHYDVLRQAAPVHYLPQHGYWIVLGYDAVANALRQPQLFSSAPGRQLDPVLVGADPPDHARARRLVAPCFSAPAIRRLEAFARETAEALLGEARSNDECDMVRGFAVPLTELTVARLIGASDEEAARLRSRLRPHTYDLPVIAGIIGEWASEWTGRADSNDDTSLGAQLLRGDGDSRFTPAEVSSVLRLLWIAGTTTTSMLIVSSIRLLVTRPELRTLLRDDLTQLPAFIEEVLRFETPEQMAWRTTTAAVDVSGVTIPAGAEVHLSLGAANRDPLHFADAASFLPRRPANDHLAFAAGAHYCLGASLARLEARVALETLLTSWPDCRGSRHPATHAYLESFHFRALKALWVSPS